VELLPELYYNTGNIIYNIIIYYIIIISAGTPNTARTIAKSNVDKKQLINDTF
jgi:hypothetical protein